MRGLVLAATALAISVTVDGFCLPTSLSSRRAGKQQSASAVRELAAGSQSVDVDSTAAQETLNEKELRSLAAKTDAGPKWYMVSEILEEGL